MIVAPPTPFSYTNIGVEEIIMNINITDNGMKKSSNPNWGIVLLRKIPNVIEILTNAFAIIGYVMLTVTILAATLSRYVFQSPLTWTVALSRLVFIWVVLLGVSTAERENAHFKINIFVERFPCSLKVFIKLLADLIVIATLIILFFISLPYVHQGSDQVDPVIRISFNYFYISLPIGVILTLFARLQKIWHRIREISNFSQLKIAHIRDKEQIAHQVKKEGK